MTSLSFKWEKFFDKQKNLLHQKYLKCFKLLIVKLKFAERPRLDLSKGR